MRTALARGTGLAVLVGLLLCPIGASAQDTKDPKNIEQAKQHMAAGAAFYNDPSGPKCEEAYREFSKAYSLSGSLNALKGMGVCALELERDGDAIDHLTKYLEGKGAEMDAAERTQVENDLTALRAAVAWVTIKADRDGVRISDTRTPSKGFPITNRYIVGTEGSRLGIHPGQHKIVASVDGAEPQEWKVEISNGGTYEHTFTFGGEAATTTPVGPVGPVPDTTQPDEPGGERPIPATVYIFGGLTVALAVPMTIFMITASGAKSDFDAANGNAPAAELEELRDDVTTKNLLADIFLGATVASAAATAIFFFTRPTVETQTGSMSWSVTPAFGPTGGGASATVTF